MYYLKISVKKNLLQGKSDNASLILVSETLKSLFEQDHFLPAEINSFVTENL